MKVIREIIDYLYFQHHLSTDDLGVFEEMGSLEGTTVGSLLRELARGAEPKLELDRGPSDREEFIEQTEALFDRVAGRSRRSSRKGAPRCLAEGKILSDRLLGYFAEGAEALKGLRVLASAIGPAENLSTSLWTLSGAEDEDLRQATSATLRQKEETFLEVWDAGTHREHRFILEPGEHGPAAVAYRALLEGIAPNELGRYVVALSVPGLNELMRLVNAQRRCPTACCGH